MDYILYFIFSFLPFILYVFPIESQKKDMIGKTAILGSALFFCTGYMTGSDWRQYEVMYSNVDWSDFVSSNFFEDPLYLLIQLLFKSIGLDFWFFHISLKLFCFYIQIYFIRKVSGKYFLLIVSVYLCFTAPFLFIDSPFRNLLALSISLYGLVYLIEHKNVKFFITMIIATLFHKSAIVILLLYLVLPMIKLSNRMYIYLIFGFYLIPMLFADQFMNILFYLIGRMGIFDNLMTLYFEQTDDYSGKSIAYFGVAVRLIMFMIIISKREYFFKRRDTIVVFNGAILYLLVYRVGLEALILSRYEIYFYILFCISIVMAIENIKSEMRLIYRNIFLSGLCMIMLFTVIGSKYSYLPYSSYFSYLFKEKPGFYYRAQYNYRNTPNK